MAGSTGTGPERQVDRDSAATFEGEVPDLGGESTAVFAASRVIPLTVGACFLMEGLDSTIIATSLPQIARAMGVTASEIGIALTAYLVSVSMWMAASGWLAACGAVNGPSPSAVETLSSQP